MKSEAFQIKEVYIALCVSIIQVTKNGIQIFGKETSIFHVEREK